MPILGSPRMRTVENQTKFRCAGPLVRQSPETSPGCMSTRSSGPSLQGAIASGAWFGLRHRAGLAGNRTELKQELRNKAERQITDHQSETIRNPSDQLT